VLENATRAARQVVERYDREEEGRRLAASMRDSVAQTGLAAVGGVGLGAIIVAIIGTAAADITGILAGVVIAGLGLYIIPRRRRRAQQQFHLQSEELRERLDDAMTGQFTRQLEGSLENIRTALAPYVRFVRAEYERANAVEGNPSLLSLGLTWSFL